MDFTTFVTASSTYFGVTDLPAWHWQASIYDAGQNGYDAFQIDDVQVAVPELPASTLVLLGGALLFGLHVAHTRRCAST